MNGKEAIDLVWKDRDIDVMLCDIKMPGMEDSELIEKIRGDNKDIVIIVITAAASPGEVCDAMRKGANNFMRKPLDVNQLKMTIKNAIT